MCYQVWNELLNYVVGKPTVFPQRERPGEQLRCLESVTELDEMIGLRQSPSKSGIVNILIRSSIAIGRVICTACNVQVVVIGIVQVYV